ncbi:PspA/IM30 family protein [Vibrio tapetis]|uniref:PspA/IM30 family protein n=1 Tax=Vibrio tapetis subsp. tapetis TaxID=1671868 RepID=A0A2N8Z872_9VIBR|nr:PspA/IM30 family protein [Vibrio tapetis]SON48076.1 conserved protein of unknown function [Vibrio tapetis subsp. tapetis]
MSVWKKLFTAIKGGVNEAAEGAADNQALRILDQEIREAKEELRKSDQALVSIVAKRKLAENKASGFSASISEYEAHARSAMEKGEQALALECAGKVAEFTSQQSVEQKYAEQFGVSEQKLKENIAQAKDKLRQLEQQVDVVKANEAVQKAQTAVSSTNVGANSKMTTAVESLERIKNRQAEKQAQLEAAEEMHQEQTGSSLDKKLAQAGITSGGQSSAEDELARILGK